MRFLLLAVMAVLMAGCQQTSSTTTSSTSTTSTTEATSAPQAATPGVTKMPNGLVIEDLAVGNGAIAEDGKTIFVHYTGRLLDGREFDSSRGKEPLRFTLGAGQVVAGWEQGIRGMRVGGKRKLTVPPALGYGEGGFPGTIIGPNATLVFDLELMNVR